MKTSFSQLITGLVIVGIGIGYLLDNLGIINFGNVIGDWWPLLIVLVGVVSFISNPRNIVFPISAVVIGALLQLRELNVLDFNVVSLIWPAILILFGLNILFSRMSVRPRETNDEVSSLFAVLSGIESKNKATNYTGGKLTAMLGGVALDLRDAATKDGAVIDAFAFMGGIELRVPEGWRVHVSGTPLLGGWEDKTVKPTSDKAPLLTVHATCVMGGIEIKN